jgi:Na+-translocating ferredoxin:NAD+ oxidoreductase RnfD subunit
MNYTDRTCARAFSIAGSLLTGIGLGLIQHKPTASAWLITIGFLITVFVAKLVFSEDS